MYQPIIQPTLRQSEDQLHSTPKYVLKVPIPQLQSLSGMQPQISSFQNSGQKDNPLNTVTFDKRWNPENQVSDKKNILSQSAKKVNTENDDGSSVVEKSFSEAAQKILKIKNLELENKVSLLVIENERLTTFLNDQFQENEKLTNELQNCQQNLSELSKVYEDKLNVVLLENSKLIKINSTLENKNEQLNQQFLKFRSEKENEVLQTKSEWANKYQSQINSIDEKHKYEITNQVEKLQFEKSEFSILIQEQQQKLREFQIELKTKDLQLTEFENIKVDFANKINRIEVMSQTILAQENRINDLENRLDIMVADNKQLQDVNEQLNQTQRILQGTLEERQITFDMEQNKLKEFYEQELKGINNKSKQQNDDLKLFHQEQMNSQRIQIENELIKELELLKIEIETKQNELNNNLLLWQEKEKNLIQENKKEQQIKDEMINTLKISNKSLQDQMNELQLLVQKMQEDFEQKFEQKEQELVKMAKSVHIKEQTIKQTSVRLDEICKQIKIMEDQRDELSIEINKKTELIKELEQKLDIVIKENDNFLNQLKITDSQLQLSQQQYQNLVKASEQKIEDIKLTYSLEVQASIEQCITQYQETIKYEQDHSDKLMKNLKKQEEKAKHYELLNEQQLNDMEKLNKRIEELLDVCEQSGQRLLQLEGIMKEKDYQIEQLNIKLEQITNNYEIQFDMLKKQMYDQGMQNEDLAEDFHSVSEKLNNLEDQKRKILGDLAEVTRQKIDGDSQIKKLKNQVQQLENEFQRTSEEAIKFRNQVYQLQQENEEITRSLSHNYQEKEQELLSKYESTIYELKSQLNHISSKYSDLVKKEKDNRFRLKLLKSNPSVKLPQELEDENCYQTMKRKMEDQSQYLQRLILENDDLKQQQYQHIKQQKIQKESISNNKDYASQDSERTLKQVDKYPVRQVNFNKQSTKIPQPKIESISNKPLDRDVYLSQMHNVKTEPHLYRKQSLQRF